MTMLCTYMLIKIAIITNLKYITPLSYYHYYILTLTKLIEGEDKIDMLINVTMRYTQNDMF